MSELLSEEVLDAAWDAWHEAHDPPNAQMRAALFATLLAVLPVVVRAEEERVRRECAEELRAVAGSWTPLMVEQQLLTLADEWAMSSSPPSGKGREGREGG